jgi:hypothetical protein
VIGRIAAFAVVAALTPLAHAEPRTSNLTVYGNDACPKSTADEIVVCAREPESERYRIPKRFRETRKDDPVNRSWSSRVATLEDAARPMRPNSCSPDGSNGQTGCVAAALRQWFDERALVRSQGSGQ